MHARQKHQPGRVETNHVSFFAFRQANSRTARDAQDDSQPAHSLRLRPVAGLDRNAHAK